MDESHCGRYAGDSHVRITGTLILLISIRFPLENKDAGAQTLKKRAAYAGGGVGAVRGAHPCHARRFEAVRVVGGARHRGGAKRRAGASGVEAPTP